MKKFKLIQIDADLHSQIRFHERLLLKLGAATDPDEIQGLFSELCYARHHLYTYLEENCGRTGDKPTVFLRFL